MAPLDIGALDIGTLSTGSLLVGAFRVTLVRAGVYWWDGGAFFGVVPKTLWGSLVEVDELNRIPAAFNCYLVETPEARILIETGGGVRHDERSRERMRLPPTAPPGAAAPADALDPASIDIVINSHLHWDHCGGNTIDSPAGPMAAFPNARYIAQRGEWDHARERLSRDSTSYRDINYEPLIACGQMTLLEGDAEIAPGVWMQVTPGHNRDMCIVLARSLGETFCFWSDLIPLSGNLHPTWVAAFDLYPLLTIENKARLLEQAVNERWWCGFAHDPKIPYARIGRDSKGKFYIL